MFVAPRSHLAGTPQHRVPAVGVDGRSMEGHPNAAIFYSAAQKPDPDDVFAVPMYVAFFGVDMGMRVWVGVCGVVRCGVVRCGAGVRVWRGVRGANC